MRDADEKKVLERLEALERQNRSLRRLVTAAMLMLAWPLLVAVEKAGSGKVVEAEKVVIRDGKGEARAELGTAPDGAAVLSFVDREGRTNVALRGVTAGPILEMADGAGGSVWLSSSATGASLAIGKGKGEMELAVNASGEPSIKLQDREGKIAWHAP